MKYFQYRALDRSGVLKTGSLAALDNIDLERRLAAHNLDLLQARSQWLSNARSRKILSRTELITFTFHLQQLLQAGVPLLQALSSIAEISEKTSQRLVIARLIDEIENGASFSAACKQLPAVFHPLYCSLLEVGETSGRLAALLGELADLLKMQDETAAGVKKALMYPVFVAVVLLAVIMFVMVYLVPAMLTFMTVSAAPLPWHTELLISCSRFISDYWSFLLATVVAVSVLLPLGIRKSNNGRIVFDRLLLRTPLLGQLLFKVRIARFSRCAALMYSAGIGLPQILTLAPGIVNCRVLGAAFEQVRSNVFDGQAVAVSFEQCGCFPSLVVHMLAIGEATGEMDRGFNQISYFYDRQSADAIENMQQSIGPILIVIVGAVMMWVVISVIGPIYDLVFNMQGQY